MIFPFKRKFKFRKVGQNQMQCLTVFYCFLVLEQNGLCLLDIINQTLNLGISSLELALVASRGPTISKLGYSQQITKQVWASVSFLVKHNCWEQKMRRHLTRHFINLFSSPPSPAFSTNISGRVKENQMIKPQTPSLVSCSLKKKKKIN